ncbi:MAG: propionyl-CoA carboxylase [Firmicutes bacterium]|nr:propionyl-CoA carboxylase [Bacillota bacterium]
MTRAERAAIEREKNLAHWKEKDAELLAHRDEAYNVGGPKQVERLAKQGKKTPRELLKMLIDPGTDFFEIGLDCGFNIGYAEMAHVPGGGLITGVGKVEGKDCMLFINESRMAAGSYFPITLKKHMRAQRVANELRLPCIYVADSGGIFLPLQIGSFADEGMFGSMFYNMTNMSARGIKQYTLSTGGNTAGGAYIVYLACESIMIDKLANAFLAGPPMVKSAIGEDVSHEDLGGAYVHTKHSGGCDHFVRNQDEGIARLRELISFDPPQNFYTQRRESKPPKYDLDELMRWMPADTYQPIDIKQVIKCIVDDSHFSEYKENYGPGRGDSVICGKAFIDGIPVGIVASNKNGTIFTQAAQKASEFIVRCGNDGTALLFIQGAPGYMVGKAEEWAGIGKYGSDMVRVVSCAKVPKIQLVVGPDHGAANYGMCGRAFRPNFVFQTMRGRTTVMSGTTAGFILETLRRVNAKKDGKEINEEEMAAFRKKMIDRYDAQGHPFFTGALNFHDGVITHAEVRPTLARALELAWRVPLRHSDWGNVKF